VLAAAGIVLAVALVAVMTLTADPFDPDGLGPGQDARAYWAAPLDAPYAPGSVGHESAYLYSPAFLQALTPLRVLSWPLFLCLWTVLLLLVLRWLSGPLLFGPLIVLTLPELWGGNITILLAAMIVAGFVRPGVWAFALLTKVTPALGLLWFGVRQEWRALLEVALVTLAIVGVSWLIAPELWRQWLDLLVSSVGSSTVPGSVPVPLLVRVPFGIVIIAVAALRGWRWLLPVGVLLVMPVIWWGSFAILAASVALERPRLEGWLTGRRRVGREPGVVGASGAG
jgi:Glycosyltransferase family 87